MIFYNIRNLSDLLKNILFQISVEKSDLGHFLEKYRSCIYDPHTKMTPHTLQGGESRKQVSPEGGGLNYSIRRETGGIRWVTCRHVNSLQINWHLPNETIWISIINN